MSASDALEMSHQAVMVALVISAPILAVGLLIGLAISVLQAVTQLQEQTLSFVPKMVAMAAAAAFFLPWLVTKLVEYATATWTNLAG